MSISLKDAVDVIASENVSAAKLGMQLEVGKVITNKVKGVIVPKLPMMIRGYADNKLFDVVIANIISIALVKLRPSDPKAQYVAEALINSAAIEVVRSFDIESFIDYILNEINIPSFATQTDELNNITS